MADMGKDHPQVLARWREAPPKGHA
jgi:hypothetical protein